MPILIIRKETDLSRTRDYDNVKEFKSIEEAIADLETDPNVPLEKIEKLKSSLKNLENKTSIKIKNGEIIK